MQRIWGKGILPYIQGCAAGRFDKAYLDQHWYILQGLKGVFFYISNLKGLPIEQYKNKSPKMQVQNKT